MADDGEIDIEGDFDLQIAAEGGFYDANELPSKSANLHPEYTNPPWMLEQGWTLDSTLDEKSKATIEKMLQEEQQHLYNGKVKGRFYSLEHSPSDKHRPGGPKLKPTTNKRPWTEEEKGLFCSGLEIYGRSWTKIAELIPSRTTLQVKNYAQQYFKNLAKKAESPALPSTSSLGPSVDTRSPLASVLAAVTTGQPTVPQARLARARSSKASAATCTRPKATAARSVPEPLAAPGKIQRVRQRKVHLSKTELENHLVNADLTPPDVTLLISETELPEEVITAPNSLTVSPPGQKSVLAPTPPAPLQTSQAASERPPDKPVLVAKSDDPDIEVDIENDDDDEDNPILQSRSTSPSSVYEKLLQSANVEITAPSETAPDSGERTTECQTGVASPASSRASSEKDGSEGSGAGSEDGAGCGGASLSQLSMEDGDLSQDQTCAMSDTSEEASFSEEAKIIVNGLLSSSGEILEFAIPSEEIELEGNSITEEEKAVHTEFFDGRPSKTPERYLKIRNYIVDCWKRCRPAFLNKTSVRPGLKNCGDVNCIGRIHAYLECIGAINFNCEQAAYNNPGKSIPSLLKKQQSVKEIRQTINSQKIEAMRPRKRRIRDPYGQWVDTREMEGKTIEHSPVKLKEQSKKVKTSQHTYDPFKLVPCSHFSAEHPSPFSLQVYNTVLAIVDVHCHISQTEVMGLLGGSLTEDFDRYKRQLTVAMAVPCKSVSTKVQCEMDPVSEIEAAEVIVEAGMQVVGWYHSHPVCPPHPSVRDIENQLNLQQHFRQYGKEFIGIIVSPHLQMHSGLQCFTLSDQISDLAFCNTPYQFKPSIHNDSELNKLVTMAVELAENYAPRPSRVELLQPYNEALGISFLDKMMKSVRRKLLRDVDESDKARSTDDLVESTLTTLEGVFREKFSQTVCAQPPLPIDKPLPPVSSSSATAMCPPSLALGLPALQPADTAFATEAAEDFPSATSSEEEGVSLVAPVGTFSLAPTEVDVSLVAEETVSIATADVESAYSAMLSPSSMAVSETASASVSTVVPSTSSVSDTDFLAYIDRIPIQEIALPDTVPLTL